MPMSFSPIQCLLSGRAHDYYALMVLALISIIGIVLSVAHVAGVGVLVLSLISLIISVGVIVDMSAHTFCH